MPSMMEIYQRHSREYDALVTHEDVHNNLGSWLMKNVNWMNAIVCEAGAGTGRVTKLYIDKAQKAYIFDRSLHMLSALEQNLFLYKDKIITAESEHAGISINEKADIFIEGWSFGHAVIEHSDRLSQTVEELEQMIAKTVRAGGTSIIIETLGTNVAAPNAPEPTLALFYRLLETNHGYTRHIISTDYRFPSVEEASRIMGFFFGEIMKAKILQQGRSEVVEFTGVWVK